MYPTLFDFFADTFGVELSFLKFFNSFGVFVALAFITAHYIFTLEMKRKEREGVLHVSKKKTIVGKGLTTMDIVLNVGLGFLLGFKLLYLFLNFDETVQDPPAFILSSKGSWIGGILFAALFFYMKYRENKKQRLPEPKEIWVEIHPYEHVGNMTLYAALFGILGAKLFHLFENPSQFADLFDGTAFFSGLTMYGGLICGGTAVIIYMKRAGLHVLHSMDTAAAALIVGYGIGRIGCQVAGDGDWGIDNLADIPAWMSWLPDWMWSYDYPNNVNNHFDRAQLQEILLALPEPISISGLSMDEYIALAKEHNCNHLPNPVYPTPFYETLMSFGIFGILWGIRNRIRIGGVLFGIYLIFNGVERFIIEQIRINELFIGTWTQAELIALLLIALGAGMVWYLWRKGSQKKESEGLEKVEESA